jgi:hypothetical protein
MQALRTDELTAEAGEVSVIARPAKTAEMVRR